ncbi:MAG: hypothetical protein IT462_15420 [Planctomycetes bacterium]|nr:hypothetical protein [Planctomycetota bacterium]
MADDLQPLLNRARRRWLVARALDAGGRWAALPALLAAATAGVLLIAAPGNVVAVILVSVVGLVGIAATVVIVGAAHATSRSRGAPDWALALDRYLGLNEQLVTLMEGAGAFAPILSARLGAHAAASPARAFPLRLGALAVAILLTLLPLGLIAWQPPQNPGAEPNVASNGGGNPGGGAAQSPQNPGKGDPKEGQGGGEKPGDQGKPKTGPGKQPSPGGATPPPEAPKEVKNDGGGGPNSPGEQPTQPKEPKPEEPPPKIDNRDLPIKPEAGEGERRAEERRRWIYDENGKPVPGAGAPGSDWKSKAEESIPRLKLTTRERKLLEDWFKQLGN